MASSIMADGIREWFSQVMSTTYQQEVPQYGTLLEPVADANLAVLENNPRLHEKMVNAGELARLNVGCHEAVRTGTVRELVTLRRMLIITGAYPVSYYGLSQAGAPVHSTAFRPIDDVSLTRDPFRVFTSLLRLELIENEILRQKAVEILRRRDAFTPCCRQLLEEYEQQGDFNEAQAQEFVREAPETFRWHQSVTVDKETYHILHNKSRLIADVVCFPRYHINRLTPRTLDINRVQLMMPEYGIKPKVLIGGPPRREVPISLRQTSFKALEETVLLAGQKQGTHTACSGKIKQRGMALTPKERQLRDDLLRSAGTGQGNPTHQMHLQEISRTFPGSEFLMCQ